MFELPSLWNLIVSTVVFFVAAWYLHRYLDDQGMPRGMTRGVLVFTLAYVVSWGTGELVDKLAGTKAASPAPGVSLLGQ